MALKECPPHPDEYAVAFLLHHLPQAEEDDYRQHLLTCSTCRALYETARDFLERCPPHPGDHADDFLLHHLPEAEEEDYRQHLLTCSACRALYETARDFRDALQEAVTASDFSAGPDSPPK